MPARAFPQPGVTVLGNLAIDQIDGAAPSAGGCPSFAGLALGIFGDGRIVTRAAPDDLPLFADVIEGSGVPVEVLPAESTSAFGLHYHGDDRTMSVDAIGPVWGPADIAAAQIKTAWVHVSPLLRSDFPAEALAALAAAGHRVAYDGQGLVRAAQTGPLRSDAAFDRALLGHLTVLKLADDEARAITGGSFGPEDARTLGVPEILVTYGSRGCELFVDGVPHAVPPAWRVPEVHTTGAGDLFTVSYVAARARGDAPLEAAHEASRLVSELLQVRREAGA